MNVIKILPDILISQIAAGEVIERPASAVKELIENSLDAGASSCSVELEQGGMRLIAVRDNGCGMNPEDAVIAFSRHATSKIKKLDDLSEITSYGFRGEALAAIASVSLITIKTRQKEENVGTEVRFSGGKIASKNPIGCPPGTEIVVRNLFFNTPARKKFLKTDQTELSHIISTVNRAAISNPQVGFELKHNGKLIFSAAPSTTETRLCDILGRNFWTNTIPVSFATPSLNIAGFIGIPGMPRSSKRHQYLFINGRDVTDPLISRAVADAYGSRLPARHFPIFTLNVDLDPHDVDVNVHPKKLAVKFLDSGRIYRDIFQAISQALEAFENKTFGPRQNAEKYAKTAIAGKNAVQEAIDFSKNFYSRQKRPEGIAETNIKKYQIISQIAESYILAMTEEGLLIIDQHAAHERILYERFKQSYENLSPQTQLLLAPVTIECSGDEVLFLKETLAHLNRLGFEFDQWSGNTFVIRSCPSAMRHENLEKMFKDFLDDAMSEKTKKELLPERILKTLACKAAVKFGMKLSIDEQIKLLDSLETTPNNSTCPHGRPVKVVLTFDELEQRFYRK